MMRNERVSKLFGGDWLSIKKRNKQTLAAKCDLK